MSGLAFERTDAHSYELKESASVHKREKNPFLE